MTTGSPCSLHIDTARTWRGGQQQALFTVDGLRARGYRTVLVAHRDGVLAARAGGHPDTHALSIRGELDVRAAWRLATLLRDLQPDIVHAHDPHGVAMAAMALSVTRAWRSQTHRPAPALVAARRVDFHLQRNALSRWKYRQVDLFIAASEAIRQMLLHDGIEPGRTCTVHEGVDIARIDGLPPVDLHAALWLPHGAPIIVNVGALVPHKGQRTLVDAMARVHQQMPDARLVILGEGELRGTLERQVHQAGLEKHILLPGFRTDVIGCLKQATLFVMSSITEGLGTSLLDAMACGAPIVASRTGGIPEVVDDGVTGRLVPPGDPVALAAAIVAMLSDAPARTRVASAARDAVQARFSVERMVDATLDAYAQLADRPHAADSARPPAAR